MSDLSNASIAALLYEAAELLELAGENTFRVRAYQKAAQIVAGLTREAAAMSGEELLAVPGIGKGISAHIAAIKDTGTFPELEESRKKFPTGLLEILKVQGIGAGRAEGTGPAPGRMLYWEALTLAEGLLAEMSALGFKRAAFAGSLRRGKETIGDLDILAIGRADGSETEKFGRLAGVAKVLAAGPAKTSVLLKSGIQCDLRIVPPAVYGSALNYFTGSKEHNILLREYALKKGLSLSEYGLCRLSDKEHKHPVASATEEDVYEALGLQYIPPELREGRDEIALAAKRRLPELVTLADIKGDAHNHTDLTDGVNSMREMAAAARGLGFQWYFAGDHSRPLGIVHGLDPEKYSKSRDKLFELAKHFPGLSLGRSLEMEILKDGSLGFTGEEAREVDFIIGSVHSSMKLGRGEMTARMLRAMSNPCLDAVGHASGRQMGRRSAMELDYPRLFEAAAEYDTAFEINGQPERQDLTDITARMAKEAGVKILLSTDAHSAAQLAYMRVAVIVARRAGLEKKDVLNSLSYKDFCGWISARRARKRQ